MRAPLPPLPPVPGVDADTHRPDGSTLPALVDADHQALESLCAQIVREPAVAERARLVDVLVATATRHLSAEEQYLYPTVRQMLDDGERLAQREIDQDLVIQRALAALHAADAGTTAAFEGLLRSVSDPLHDHINRIRHEILPRLRQRLSTEDQIRLGNRLALAREAAPTRPHPATPPAPPWNKIVDPGVGVIDKVRDAVSGRTTRVDDLK